MAIAYFIHVGAQRPDGPAQAIISADTYGQAASRFTRRQRPDEGTIFWVVANDDRHQPYRYIVRGGSSWRHPLIDDAIDKRPTDDAAAESQSDTLLFSSDALETRSAKFERYVQYAREALGDPLGDFDAPPAQASLPRLVDQIEQAAALPIIAGPTGEATLRDRIEQAERLVRHAVAILAVYRDGRYALEATRA